MAGWGRKRDEKRCSCWRELRDLGPLGSRTVRLSHSGREAPCELLSPLLGLLLSASASGSRSCPPVPCPPEVTPTALIIFCFALGLFSTTNFQQSPWRRAGEGGAQLWKSQGLAARRPQQTFPGLQALQAGWESALSWATCTKSPAGLRDPRLHAVLPSAAATRLGDLGTTRLLLDPGAKPRRRHLAGGEGGASMPLYGTHTQVQGGRGSPVWT